MSQRLLKALGGITSIAMAAALLHAPPAQADPGDHFNSSINVDVAGGGSATIASPTMAKDMKKAGIDFTTSPTDAPEFEDMALALVQQPSPAHRIVACAIMSAAAAVGEEALAAVTDSLDGYEAVAQSRFLARLLLCVKIAQLIASYLADPNARPLRAGTACGQAPVAVKEEITKSGGMFHLTAKAPAIKPSKMRVKVKCTVVSDGKVAVKVKPKKKGTTLRKALASKNLGTGIGSPSSASEGARVKVGFKAP